MRDDSSALEFKAESDFFQSLFAHGVAQASLIFGIKHKKTSSAGADQFASGCTIREGAPIPMIDVLIRHKWASGLLMLPMNVHQTAEFGYITPFQCAFRGFREFFDEMEIVDHFRIGQPAFLVLVLQNRR